MLQILKAMLWNVFNPLTDEQHFNAPQNVTSCFCFFSSLGVFCLRRETIRRRATRWLMVLHPKQNIEGGLQWQTSFGTVPSIFSGSSVKSWRKDYFSILGAETRCIRGEQLENISRMQIWPHLWGLSWHQGQRIFEGIFAGVSKPSNI